MPDAQAFIEAYHMAQAAWAQNQRFGPNAFVRAGANVQMGPMQVKMM